MALCMATALRFFLNHLIAVPFLAPWQWITHHLLPRFVKAIGLPSVQTSAPPQLFYTGPE
jgi:hypothetical protein